jgi:hypothetical protein
MELFVITPTHEVELNKEWMQLIPEFKNLLAADKGSKGDADGRKKLKARKQFAYIYFMVDFKSPIFSWELSERHEEAIRYTDLTEMDVNLPLVRRAYEEYQKLQYKAARSLKTLENAYKALDSLDNYLGGIDFKEKDKQGKLLHNPKEVGSNISQLNKMFDELDKFEKRVHEQLKESTTIRGQATLGDKEHRKTGTETWEEGSQPLDNGTRWDNIRSFTKNKPVTTEQSSESLAEDSYQAMMKDDKEEDVS